jgi:hypothetical protein
VGFFKGGEIVGMAARYFMRHAGELDGLHPSTVIFRL